MFVDLSNFLNDISVTAELKVNLRTNATTDEFGIQNEISNNAINVVGAVVEKIENGLNTNTGMYFERVVYKIYLDRTKYSQYDFTGAEIDYNGKILKCTSYPLNRSYASHFVITATEKKVNGNA